MSQLAHPDYDSYYPEGAAVAYNPDQIELPYSKRSFVPTLWFTVPVLLSSTSYAAGGITGITNMAMMMLAMGCGFCILSELKEFTRRFGVGAITLYTGILVWFCHDYFTNWTTGAEQIMGAAHIPVGPEVVAKGALVVSIFSLAASIGLHLKWGGRIARMVGRIPEPVGEQQYLRLIVLVSVFGLSPYFIFTRDPIGSLLRDMSSMRGDAGASWTVGRTGNYNYSLGAYVAQWLQVGDFAGLLAACYALLLAKNPLTKAVCWFFWAIAAGRAWGTGSRGTLLFEVLPVVMMLFMKYQMAAAAMFQRFSLRSYVYICVVLLFVLGLVQFQGQFRNLSRDSRGGLSDIRLLAAEGNTMFSEPLVALKMVPDQFPHPEARFPLSEYIMPLPDVALRWAIGWIPRVLWPSKPGISDFAAKYNEMISGGSASNEGGGNGQSGGTVCLSVAGGPYVQYGWLGLIEMSIFFGWMCGLSERAFLESSGRLMPMLVSLGMCTYMFRAFRDLSPQDFYPLAIGATVISFAVLAFRGTSAQ